MSTSFPLPSSPHWEPNTPETWLSPPIRPGAPTLAGPGGARVAAAAAAGGEEEAEGGLTEQTTEAAAAAAPRRPPERRRSWWWRGGRRAAWGGVEMALERLMVGSVGGGEKAELGELRRSRASAVRLAHQGFGKNENEGARERERGA